MIMISANCAQGAHPRLFRVNFFQYAHSEKCLYGKGMEEAKIYREIFNRANNNESQKISKMSCE